MSSASRTNLTSKNVTVHHGHVIGEGAFRIAYAGTYLGGNRNQQEAVCKVFKDRYKDIEAEFFLSDFSAADRAIDMAECWNGFCQNGKEILITRGDVMEIGSVQYLVEPLIRNFTKFTSNNGWIASEDEEGWAVLAMEAFSHFTYHKSGGQLIVCDLQGRYRYNRYNRGMCRFELTDTAICSRSHKYGPTDLGEKGIETFFANHTCNKFCHFDGNHWASPRNTRLWFECNSNTSMLCSQTARLLETRNRARFTSTLEPVYDNYDEDDSDYDSY